MDSLLYILVYACGPKTVLVKSTFLGFPTNMVFGPLARVERGGVGCNNVLSTAFFCMQLATRSWCYAATVPFVTCNTLLMLRCYRSACNLQHALDAAWSALKDYIPNSLSSHSRDLLLHCKSWQWRYINLHANLQKKTLDTLNRIFWEKAARRQALHEPMKMSWHCGKTRKRPKNGSKF